LKHEVEFRYGGRFFFQNESRELSYVDDILVWWQNLIFWRSEVNNWEIGSSIESQRLPSLKIDMTSYLCRG